MTLRFALFYVVVLAVLLGLGWLVHRRASEALGLGKRGRRWLALGLLVALLLALLGRLAGRLGWAGAPGLRPATLLGSAVLTGVLVSAGLLLLLDAGRLLGWLLGRLRAAVAGATGRRELAQPAGAAEPASEERGAGGREPGDGEAGARVSEPAGPAEGLPAAWREPMPRRRALLRVAQGAAVGTGFVLGGWGTAFGRLDLQVETLVVPLRGLPRALDGYTLLQVSDVHVGAFVGEPELRAALQVARGVRPDLVVLTGDLVDHDPSFAPLLGRFARRLGELARDGAVAVPGNHDYYAGIEDVLVALHGAGVRVLLDSAVRVGDGAGGFALLGVDDLWASRMRRGRPPRLERALAALPEAADLPRVLLAHNPAYFPRVAGKVQLQLSGHTHGGQINVGTRLPAELVLPYGYVAGRYERDGSLLYVNRGLGTAGPPARVGSPPELTRVVLTSA